MTVGAIHESRFTNRPAAEAASGECAQANPKNRSCTAGPFVNGLYGVYVGCLLNKPDTQIVLFY